MDFPTWQITTQITSHIRVQSIEILSLSKIDIQTVQLPGHLVLLITVFAIEPLRNLADRPRIRLDKQPNPLTDRIALGIGVMNQGFARGFASPKDHPTLIETILGVPLWNLDF